MFHVKQFCSDETFDASFAVRGSLHRAMLQSPSDAYLRRPGDLSATEHGVREGRDAERIDRPTLMGPRSPGRVRALIDACRCSVAVSSRSAALPTILRDWFLRRVADGRHADSCSAMPRDGRGVGCGRSAGALSGSYGDPRRRSRGVGSGLG